MDPGARDFLYDEIIGLEVVSIEGRHVGRVTAIMKTGANDVYFVKPDDSDDETLIPAIKQVIKDIDLEAGIITIEMPAGLE